MGTDGGGGGGRARGARGARTARDAARRALSQNFLREGPAIAQFLDAFGPAADADLVLEAGAGDGALTEALAPRCRELVAYEIDPAFARRLRARVADLPSVRVIEGDFLAARPPPRRFQVAANIPFSLTAKIVDWCLLAPALTSATLITQLEYAKKRTGAYGRWSLLTVRTWPTLRWELRGRIPRAQFRPVPAVDAGILRIARRDVPLIDPARTASYDRMVALGFTGVGGTLYASLARRYPPGEVAAAFTAAGLDRGVVVAFVHPDDWLRLFAELGGPG